MSTAAALQAAIDRPLPLRMRPDLVVVGQNYEGRRYFVIKDPVTLGYYYLSEQEHFTLVALDGQTSLSELQQRFAARFAPQQVTVELLQAFLSHLHRSGLIRGLAAGQGEQLVARRSASQQFDVLRYAEKLLAFRWRGVNPQPFLIWLEPKVGWFFSKSGSALWLCVIGFALAVMVSRCEQIARALPEARAWLIGTNILWLGAALILIKTLHELGHAIAARRAGCACHEVGFQLFFLLPCLYANVSDVWLVPDKWKRIAVSAAGMYVELFLAAVATLIWWQAEPGVLASLCQSIMIVASVGTLALNGNPLMRYDGYYLLADFAEVPNLEQRSRGQLIAWLARWCAGVEWQPPGELSRRRRLWLAAYAAAAMAYRSALLIGVYLASRAMLRPWRLEPLSDVFVAGAALGMIIPLVITGGQFVMDARRQNKLNPARLALSGAVVILAIAVACLLPFPARITAPVEIEARDASRIYATVGGTLQTALPAGTAVKKGQVLATLRNADLQRDLTRLATEQRLQELRLVELETLRGDEPERAAQIPAVKQALADLSTRAEQLRGLIGRLTLVAPHDGIVLPPPRRQPSTLAKQLAGWLGSPLEPENRGAFFDTGTLLCLVAQPGAIEGVAIVDQADAPLLREGNKAKISAPQWPFGTIRGAVAEVAQIDADAVPLHLAATKALPQRIARGGEAQPLSISYQVRIRFDQPPQAVLPGATARARIVAKPQTLAARFGRWLSTTFRFRNEF